MTTIVAAWLDGWRRVGRAPGLVALVVALTFVVVVPFALTMRADLEAHLGSSSVADPVARGVDYDWWQEFMSQASGVGGTFTPRIVGVAATLDALSGLADARRDTTALLGLAAAYVVLWMWLLGGVLDCYARQRATRAHGFGAASGGYFWRLLRLSVVSGGLYSWLFGYLHPWLFEHRLVAVTRGLDSERAAFLWRVAAYGVFGGLVAAVNLLFDYAKIRLVVEDRRSALASVIAASRFLRRHRGPAAGLYVANTICFLLLGGGWTIVAPGAPGASVWPAFALGQLFIAARLAMKLQFLASQTSLFQASLAHARYTAAPPREWPDAPAVEAIVRR